MTSDVGHVTGQGQPSLLHHAPAVQLVLSEKRRADDLAHVTRRMLQALDAYWLGYDGLPTGRNPRGKYDSEDWWTRYEGYRSQVEAILRGA